MRCSAQQTFMYTKALNDIGIDTTPSIEAYSTSAWAQYTIRVEGRAALQAKLTQAGIPTAIHYPMPLNKQPAVADLDCYLPVGDKLSDEVIR